MNVEYKHREQSHLFFSSSFAKRKFSDYHHTGAQVCVLHALLMTLHTDNRTRDIVQLKHVLHAQNTTHRWMKQERDGIFFVIFTRWGWVIRRFKIFSKTKISQKHNMHEHNRTFHYFVHFYVKSKAFANENCLQYT